MNDSIKKEKEFHISNLSLLILFISFYNINNSELRYFGMFSIFILLSISIYDFLKPLGTRRKIYINGLLIKPIIYSLLIIGTYIISFLLDAKINNSKPLIQLILLLTFFFSMINENFSKTRYKILSFSFFVILIICYLPMVFGYGQALIGYKSIFSTATFLGIFSLFLLELSFLAFKGSGNMIFILYTPFFLILIISTQTRVALLALCVIIFTYMFLSVKKVRIITWKLAKYSLFILLVGFITIYPNLDKYSWYPEFSQFVYNVTGKILMSGRNTIWLDAINLIEQKPFFGYGFGAFSDNKISPHNSFLGILLQSGLIGLATIILFCNSIFNIMYKYRNDPIAKICTSFFIGNLVVCSFEVMLFQGQLVLSILLWLIVAIGVRRVLELRKEKADGV